MAHQLAVLSPEKTIVTYRVAGLGSRFMAQLLDWILILVAMLTLIQGVASVVPEPYASAIIGIVSSTGWLAYFALFEGLNNGQTIGKMALSIRVRMADGTPVVFISALGRNFLRVADFLPGGFLLGALAILSNPRAQRIGDFAANTIVVIEKRTPPKFVATPHQDGIHPYEAFVGDLKDVTSEEYQALRQLCDRFPQLPTTVQDRLMREVWLPIAHRRNIPQHPGAHPLSLAEAVVMKVGRERGLL